MPDARLVKHAVKMQYANNDRSNMLVDAPPTKTFNQLVKLASNRKKWDLTWSGQTENATSPAIKARWNEDAETTCQVILPQPPAAKPKKHMTAASKYRARDAHEAFFRQTAHSVQQKQKRKRKTKGLDKPAITNKQRAAWAREHH